jgi:hypothetical protein
MPLPARIAKTMDASVGLADAETDRELLSMSTIFDGPMIIENDGRSTKQVQLTAMPRLHRELDNTIDGITGA